MTQSSLFGDSINKLSIDIPDGKLILFEHFLSGKESDELMKTLIQNIEWQQDEITVFNKVHKTPRLSKWFGDEGKIGSYSGLTLLPTPWTKELLAIKQKTEQLAHHTFNSCLANYYRDGKDGMGWHQDNEKELGINPVIASVTFGEARPFQLKHINDTSIKKVDLKLTHGSLLIMEGSTQHFWKHQIPKTTKSIGERINLTFRTIIT